MKTKITMWVFSALWLIASMAQKSDIYLLIGQLWVIASYFVKDDV